ncbi:MAG TPA: hypothetical protein PLV68_09330, partial [Ilumatobacteraceae bacterium]|nr:hypothetical protein [Ilumatobacteraceae bacterium]
MDVDAFVVRHQEVWWRLAQLTNLARRPKSLHPEELDELVQLYQRTSAHLAAARVTYAADPTLVGRLTLLVADAHAVLYGQRDTDVRRSAARFATDTFPQAVYAIRWFILAATLLTLVPWAVMNVWLAVSPRAVNATGPATLRDQYINASFEEYYRSDSATAFAN